MSVELVKRFSHITITDPSEAYVSSARSLFFAFPQEKIDFQRLKAEEVSLEKLSKGEEVNLVTAAECLHWADVKAAVPRTAAVLEPGGTFAAWLYGVRPILSEKDESLAEARNIFYDIYAQMCHRYDTEKPTASSDGAALEARLDHMSFVAET